MKSRNGRIRDVIALVMVMVVVIPFGNVAAQTQEFTPESYTSVLTDFEINVSGPIFEITDATLERYRTGEGEVVSIESDLAILEVSFFDDEDTPDDSLDAYVGNIKAAAETFDEVARSNQGDVYSSFSAFTYDGVDMVMYAQVTEDVVGSVDLFEMIITGADSFQDDLADAQSEIDIDGIAFLADVDGSTLMGDSSTTNDDSGTSLTGNPRDDARVDTTTEDSDQDEQSTPEVNTGDTSVPGVLTDSSWEGPLFGRVIGWDSTVWWVDLSYDDSVRSEVPEDSDREMDAVTLSGIGWSVEPYVDVSVGVDGTHTVDDYAAHWSSDEYIQEEFLLGEGGEYEVIASRTRSNGASVATIYTLDGEQYVHVSQITDLGDGTFLIVNVDASAAEIVDVYDQAFQDITLDGDPISQILTTNQLERALGE